MAIPQWVLNQTHSAGSNPAAGVIEGVRHGHTTFYSLYFIQPFCIPVNSGMHKTNFIVFLHTHIYFSRSNDLWLFVVRSGSGGITVILDL